MKFVMPKIAGTLISIPGLCKLRDGSPARETTVYAGTGYVATATGSYSNLRCRTDADGRFALERLPTGQTVSLYAESPDRKFAGTGSFSAPKTDIPAFRPDVTLAPTVTVNTQLFDDEGKPLRSRKLLLMPRIADQDLYLSRRPFESDAEGRVKFDGIVPGLSYRVQEDAPRTNRQIVLPAGARLLHFDEVLVLAPGESN